MTILKSCVYVLLKWFSSLFCTTSYITFYYYYYYFYLSFWHSLVKLAYCSNIFIFKIILFSKHVIYSLNFILAYFTVSRTPPPPPPEAPQETAGTLFEETVCTLFELATIVILSFNHVIFVRVGNYTIRAFWSPHFLLYNYDIIIMDIWCVLALDTLYYSDTIGNSRWYLDETI